MAVIGNNPESFLHALSDFWTRFFADIGDIRATYEATSVLFGQAYLDLLSAVLNTSVDEAPLFRKELYRLLTIREDQVVWQQDFANLNNSRWLYTGANFSLKGLAALHNKVYKPDAALAVGRDVDSGTSSEGPLRFISQDPTEPPPLSSPLEKFASRIVSVPVGGSFSASGVDWLAGGVKKGDVLHTHPYLNIPQGVRTLADTQTYSVVRVTATELQLSTATPAPVFPSGMQQPVHWWVDREGPAGSYEIPLPCSFKTGIGVVASKGSFDVAKNVEVREVSMWAVDALVDDFTLYQNFGHLVSENKRASSEAYRALIRGVMQLYVLGPAIDRIESALNAIAFLPVIRNDGEVLQGYDDGNVSSGVGGSFAGGLFSSGVATWTQRDVGGFVEITRAEDARNLGVWEVTEVLDAMTVRLSAPGGYWAQASGVHWAYSKTDLQTVTTTSGEYSFDRRVPVRSDVADPASIGVLTFKAFETLASAIRVVDYVKDPQWWHGYPIPEELLPGKSLAQRIADPKLLEGRLGAPYGAFIGDPEFYLGANGDRVVDSSGTRNFRHTAAFVLMDRFLKAHIFKVSLHPTVKLTEDFISELSNVIREAKPAYTYAFLEPGTAFSESIAAIDALLSDTQLPLTEKLGQQAHELTLGGGWSLGHGWTYTGTYTWNGVTLTLGTGMSLVLGGLDPLASMQPQGAGEGILEAPLYVSVA